MAWIFQGSPEKMDIDGYLSRSPQSIYWWTPTNVKDIEIGDPVFIWRSGEQAGAIAYGQVAEQPTHANQVNNQELLGNEFWIKDEPGPEERRTGIKLSDVRTDEDQGMITRAQLKAHPLLKNSLIITAPNRTVFKLSSDEVIELQKLWNTPELVELNDEPASEGRLLLRQHKVRERQPRLRRDKLRKFRKKHGSLHCEICKLEESGSYPEEVVESVFEVHHITPLSELDGMTLTGMEDLAVLCASCHRAVHANKAVKENYASLKAFFAQRNS